VADRPTTVPELLRRQARHGARTFVESDSGSLSFAATAAGAGRFARALAAHGLRRGDRVAIVAGNSPEYLLTFFGAIVLGAVAVPVNTAAKGVQLARMVGDFDPTLIVDDSIGGGQATHTYGDRRVVSLAALTTAAERESGSLPDPVGGPLRPSELASLMYTSGTTGPAKGVMCPHSHPLAVARYVAAGFGIDETDRIYCCLPLFHATALWWDALAALWAGATLVLRPRFSASRFWPEVVALGATRFSAMMSMASILTSRPVESGERGHRLRATWIAPLPSPLSEWERRFGVPACTDYAMTELHPVALLGPGDRRPDRPGCAGAINPDDEVQIREPDGSERAHGQVGEIVVRPRVAGSCFSGYWGLPSSGESWFATGDLGYVEDGRLYFAGRTKDAIRRRGENVSAWEVEETLKLYPTVAEVAVLGVPSPLGEEEVACFVTTTDPLDEADLFRFAADNMAYFMVPRFVRIVPKLPRNHAFKVDKAELRELASAEAAQMWDAEAAGLSARQPAPQPGSRG
jgi:crotonobetaine/carnitine-CoA ligase